jgi:hypothetical protein
VSPAPRRTRARRHRAPSAPLERDAELPLLRLERAITLQLAESEARASCAELSAFFDRVQERERLEPVAVRAWLEAGQ